MALSTAGGTKVRPHQGLLTRKGARRPHSRGVSADAETVGQGRAGQGLTLDGQGGLALLAACYKCVLPSLGPLHAGDTESVHKPVLL